MNIIFMGTPEFAVPSLDALRKSRHNIIGVVTAPDKPAGRGLKLLPSPVKRFIATTEIELKQPENLREHSFITWLKDKNADLYVVVAFRILPPEVFELPPAGTINLHASLLPSYRGAAPINWAIIKGEKITGVTTFFIEKTVDTGNIIMQRSIEIGEDETAGELHDRLAKIGADVLVETVNAIANGTAKQVAQQGQASTAPKITREICKINWHADAQAIHNLVRGLSPHPGAITTLHGRLIKIYRTHLTRLTGVRKKVGQIVKIEKTAIQIQTGNGIISILELQPEGRRRMTAEEFLRGHSLSTLDTFNT